MKLLEKIVTGKGAVVGFLTVFTCSNGKFSTKNDPNFFKLLSFLENSELKRLNDIFSSQKNCLMFVILLLKPLSCSSLR